MPKKVLIVYASGGMGHVKAAAAIERAFVDKYPEVEIRNINVIDFANRFYRLFFVDGYNYVSAKLPKLWGWLYQTYNQKSRQSLPSKISYWAIEKRFIPYIKEYQPDFIISTHPLPMIIVSHSKDKNVIDVMSSMVCTDFGCHSFWVDPEVNYYFGATDFVRQCLEGFGVSSDKVIVTGIPIEAKFAKPQDKKALLGKFELRSDVFTMLIVGGQVNLTELEEIISGVWEGRQDKIQFLVVAGRDKYLKQALEKSKLEKNAHVKVFGFIDNMEELMTVSDLIFSKAGGLTVSECLAKGLPMVINKVIPGQEEDNVNYLVDKGAAIKVNNYQEIIGVVNDLIDQPAKVTAMKAACAAIGKPKSAEELAGFVWDKIK